jgi:hypothetical protein
MREIIRLLELKNEYLEKYLTITKVFIMELDAGELGDPELLKSNRENILGILDHIDNKIKELSEKLDDDAQNSATAIKEINGIMHARERLAREIIDVDNKLFALLEEKKTTIVNDLSKLRDVKEAVSVYEYDTPGFSGNYLNIEK